VPKRSQQLRQFLLIALMAFTLFGVQLIQSSPLHNHAQHTVDCELCHMKFSDEALLQPTLAVAFIAHGIPYAQYLREFYSFSNPSPYHGRAPPFSSR
jgi:hypothetical protein